MRQDSQKLFWKNDHSSFIKEYLSAKKQKNAERYGGDKTWRICFKEKSNFREKIKINISEKKKKCLRYRHNLKQIKRPFGRAQNITMPKY